MLSYSFILKLSSLKYSKNIISLNKFIPKGLKGFVKDDTIDIIKINNIIISTSMIKSRKLFVISLESNNNDNNNIIYNLMNQRLLHPGNNNTLKSSKIIGENF